MEKDTQEAKFIKEPEEPTKAYIFQKNAKTKIGAYIIIAFLIILALGVLLSAFYFFSPEP